MYQGGGGDGFFLACQDFGRMFDNLFIFFFFRGDQLERTLFPLFRPESVHGGSASYDDCEGVFPDELCVSSFPDRFPHYAWTVSIVSPLRLRWVKGVFRV